LDHEGAEFRMARGGAGGSGNLEKKNITILERGLVG